MSIDFAAIAAAIARLDAWLDTMHGPDGYGGPVAHWWQDCLHFTGAGLDWRYEGIILGYLNLYQRTADDRWLVKARRAGDDLLRGQLPAGNYRNSSFELNPYTAGTPHEAACDLALIHLAQVLRDPRNRVSARNPVSNGPSADDYLSAAEHNLRGFYLAHLWDAEANCFWDSPHQRSFVPNKAATLVGALLALARATGDDSWADRYARPTLDRILDHQVPDGPLAGAIHQMSIDGHCDNRFFPYYIARAVPGLLAGYEHLTEDRYLDAALHAMAFVGRQGYADGSYPQVVYANGHVNRYPQWIAAVGDILRAVALLEPHGLDVDPGPALAWLLRGQEPSGAFRTAHGFAVNVSQRQPGALPEFRDLLPVAGWNAMAFVSLTALLPQGFAGWPTGAAVGPTSLDCTFRGQPMHLHETAEMLQVTAGEQVRYHWRKGAPWPEIAHPEFWLG